MKIKLHIGFAEAGALRIQSILADKRSQLAQKNILFPKALGPENHVRLFMAISNTLAIVTRPLLLIWAKLLS